MQVVGEGRNPREVLDVLRRQAPSALVIDPVFGGAVHLDWVERLAQLVPSTQVVVLTSSPYRALVSDAIAAGARGFLLKSSRREAIATGVRACAAGESVVAPELLEGLAGRAAANGSLEQDSGRGRRDRHGPDQTRARNLPSPPDRGEQPPNRRRLRPQREHRQEPRGQHPHEAEAEQPHPGRRPRRAQRLRGRGRGGRASSCSATKPARSARRLAVRLSLSSGRL